MSSVANIINIRSEDEMIECVDWKLPLSFVKKFHTENIEGVNTLPQTWRMKERMKTVSVALVLCLNVGVDPPDIVKTQPCARLECWIDPISMSPTKALETIGSSLQKQYEIWQPRARYKQSLDPTAEEVKKLCTSLRRNAKDERVLFHYNGHGVPKPTTNGEIWVFNRVRVCDGSQCENVQMEEQTRSYSGSGHVSTTKNKRRSSQTYTQYIPLSVYDLQAWMGAPSIYVYDCSNAGTIVESFTQFADQHEKEYEMSTTGQGRSTPGSTVTFKNCIQLASCGSNQILPMNPDLPADIFTSCLTTPIKIAVRWFVMQRTSKLVPKITLDLIDKMPGKLNDRRTMLGELNWIFTAITDTIAWNTLPRDLFQKLFRQDLLVASLFRNFLLAERIMRSYDCSPISSPKLPPTYQHPMWQAWDLALDLCLAQLPGLLETKGEFVHSPFFEEQLTAFQVWLDLGSEHRSPPEQLPIVLQVLLSQVHRLRALELLGRFLDLGPWAVNLALSVGIFPYVLKLLQSSARELRPLLVFIWAKILAVDNTCQADLVRDNGHKYFLSVLQDPSMPSQHRTLSAFVLACIVNNYQPGQEAALQGSLISVCLEQINDSDHLLRQWIAVCLARLWKNYDRARWIGVRDIANEKLYPLLQDPQPEVRAAVVYALGTFISSVSDRTEHANNIDHSVATMLLNTVSQDMCPQVREELVVALQWMVLLFENSFFSVALSEDGRSKESPLSPNIVIVNDLTMSPQSGLRRISSRDRLGKLFAPGLLPSSSEIVAGVDLLHPSATDRIKRVSSSSSISSLGHSHTSSLPSLSFGSIYMKLWNGLSQLEHDPHPVVRDMSRTVLEHVREKVREQFQSDVQDTRTCSISLPPSPSNRTSYLSGDSPPLLASSTSDLNNKLTTTATAAAAARVPVLTNKLRKNMPNTICEETDESNTTRKPLVRTRFIDWSCKYFAQSVMNVSEENDLESKSYYEREWRYLRNAALRAEAMEEQKRMSNGRLEHQVFNSRSPDSPSVTLFHPYESHLAVGAKDYYGIWDWNTGSKLSYNPNRGTKGTKISAMEFINSHDVTLLLTGSDDGSVRLWSGYQTKEPHLVTAWQALPEVIPPSRCLQGVVGLVMSWEQRSQQLVVSGDTSKIRIWDAEKELKVVDLPLGTDTYVTCLSSDQLNCSLAVVGCGDGSVRLFDRRLPPQEARVMTWREHSARVMGVHIKSRGDDRIVSGCVAGDIRFFDLRKNSSVSTCHTSKGMNGMSVHDLADIFVCGSVNQLISVYKMNGTLLNVIKYHEGFMGARIGSVSCLTLHPHRVALAVGSVDCNLSVYAGEAKR